jgi:5'-3' exonuclease
MDRVYLVDASIYIFGAYFSLPEAWHNEEGLPTHAVCGYTRFLLDLIEQKNSRYLAVAFDESLGSCFRNTIYPAYKQSRALPDEALAFQLQACQAITRRLGIRTEASDLYEADDIIASLACGATSAGHSVSIVSKDKDLGQLLKGDKDHLFDYHAGVELDSKSYRIKTGIEPGQLVDYLALVGDRIDDVPGVPGIGNKTAVALLSRFGSVDNLLANLDKVSQSDLRGAKGIAAKIQDYEEQIRMARQLVTLFDKVPLDNSPGSLEWNACKAEQFLSALDAFGLRSFFEKRVNNSPVFNE